MRQTTGDELADQIDQLEKSLNLASARFEDLQEQLRPLKLNLAQRLARRQPGTASIEMQIRDLEPVRVALEIEVEELRSRHRQLLAQRAERAQRTL